MIAIKRCCCNNLLGNPQQRWARNTGSKNRLIRLVSKAMREPCLIRVQYQLNFNIKFTPFENVTHTSYNNNNNIYLLFTQICIMISTNLHMVELTMILSWPKPDLLYIKCCSKIDSHKRPNLRKIKA